MGPDRTTRLGLLLVFLTAFLSSSCGYALAGRGSFLPDYIRVVGVPMFVNRTPIFNLETQMTEKVRGEFLGRGHYTVVPDSNNVDALLVGEVTSVAILPISFTSEQLASRYAITMTAQVELRDVKENKVLWNNPGLIFRQEYEAQGGQAVLDPAAFFGEDANALDRITSEFARSIVNAILEAF